MPFLPNPHFLKELREQGELTEALEGAAKSASAHADAPRIMPRPGHDQFEVGTDDEGTYLQNTDYGAAIEEWGSKNSPPYAPLARALLSAGLRFEEEGKS